MTNAMRSKFNSLGKKLHRGDVNSNKVQIKELLDDDDDLVVPTLMLLQSGLMLDLFNANLKRRLPPCCTKMYLIPVKVMLKCVVAWSSFTLSEIKQIRKAAGRESKVLEMLFLFAVRLGRDDPVQEHDEESFVREMEIRHRALGKPLEAIKVNNSLVDWTSSGVYCLCDADGEEFKAPCTQIIHRASGVKVIRLAMGTTTPCVLGDLV